MRSTTPWALTEYITTWRQCIDAHFLQIQRATTKRIYKTEYRSSLLNVWLLLFQAGFWDRSILPNHFKYSILITISSSVQIHYHRQNSEACQYRLITLNGISWLLQVVRLKYIFTGRFLRSVDYHLVTLNRVSWLLQVFRLRYIITGRFW